VFSCRYAGDYLQRARRPPNPDVQREAVNARVPVPPHQHCLLVAAQQQWRSLPSGALSRFVSANSPSSRAANFHAEHSRNEAIDMEFREYVFVATMSVGVCQGLCRSELRRSRRTWGRVASADRRAAMAWSTIARSTSASSFGRRPTTAPPDVSFARGARTSRTCCRRQLARRASVRRPRRGTAAHAPAGAAAIDSYCAQHHRPHSVDPQRAVRTGRRGHAVDRPRFRSSVEQSKSRAAVIGFGGGAPEEVGDQACT
jgi:hypothetical protein